MAGTLCNGRGVEQPFVKHSTAYCEGQRYRRGGTRTARPKTSNPYGAEQPQAKIDWDRGWDHIDAANGTTLTREVTRCCDGEGIAIPAEA